MREGAMRYWSGVFSILLTVSAGLAEPLNLSETTKKGECSHIVLHMDLTGDMQATRDGKQVPLKMAASADHDFNQKVLSLNEKGMPNKAACFFEQAKATVNVGSEKSEKSLRALRKLVVSQRS